MAMVEPHDVRALARALTRAARRLEGVERVALADLGLTPATFRLLEHLARHGATSPSEAARALEVRQPTITGWLNALHAAGLLERVAVDDDGRRVSLRLTSAGRELHGHAGDLVRRRQSRVVAALDPVMQADLVASLERLNAGTAAAAAAAGGGAP